MGKKRKEIAEPSAIADASPAASSHEPPRDSTPKSSKRMTKRAKTSASSGEVTTRAEPAGTGGKPGKAVPGKKFAAVAVPILPNKGPELTARNKRAEKKARSSLFAAQHAPASAASNGHGVKLAPEKVFQNKEKVLVLSSRGIVFRYRHLMEDLITLLPHCKKDAKLENLKDQRAIILNEAADLKNCSSCIFFEGRKKKDLYMWIAKTPKGPSAKFLVNAVHTMAELKLTGNHLKGSRPILTFSPAFDSRPHLQLLKEMFTQIFATPLNHRKSKPFFDHVFSFTILDNHIWFRNYQITALQQSEGKLDKVGLDKTSLVEVGPRFCLNPIKVFAGSFGGATLYENPMFVSPNTVRSNEKKARAGKYATKVKAKQQRKQHLSANPAEPDEFADLWKD